MFISCLHCRELVATDPETRLSPVMCPRCGGILREAAASEVPAETALAVGVRSFVSFLHGDEATAVTAPASLATTGAPVEDVWGNPASASLGEAVDAQAVDAVAEVMSDAGMTDQEAPAIESQEIDADETLVATPVIAPAQAPAAQLLPALPSFTRASTHAATHPRAATWQWAALVVLSLTLALQVLLADRARLAADASWRPLITRLCDAFGCSVPPWHQPGAFAMLSRDVSPIAGGTGGLNVQATFRNDARWAQAWPVLLLSLSDADGRVLGSRAFTPREYLGATAVQAELAPGQSAQIALQLHEPNPDVVAFTFDFR